MSKPHAQHSATTTGGGGFASGCPQRPDGAAVGCGHPEACLGGWWWLGAAHPVWTAGHLWGVSCPPTMGTPRDRARTRARPQHRGAISCAPAMDGPALESWAGQAPAPCRGRALRGRGKDCVRAPVEGAAHTGGWVNPLSGCAHRGRVALARQLSPRPVACCCPQRLAPLCATDTRHACGTFQLTHGAPRPT